MASTVDLKSLGFTNVRVTPDKQFSVIDLITASGEQKCARAVWSDIKKRYPELVGRTNNFQFEGQGQRPTPVIPYNHLKDFLPLIPGKKARLFIVKATDFLLRAIGADETVLQELQEVIDTSKKIAETCPNSVEATLQSAQTPKKVSHCNRNVYIRLFDHRLGDSNTDTKLSYSVLKIGLTDDLHSRNITYGEDAGYFGYALPIQSRPIMRYLETMLKTRFRAHIIPGTQEYINADSVAKEIQLELFDQLEIYRHVARYIHTAIVTTLHRKDYLSDQNFGRRSSIVLENDADKANVAWTDLQQSDLPDYAQLIVVNPPSLSHDAADTEQFLIEQEVTKRLELQLQFDKHKLELETEERKQKLEIEERKQKLEIEERQHQAKLDHEYRMAQLRQRQQSAACQQSRRAVQSIVPAQARSTAAIYIQQFIDQQCDLYCTHREHSYVLKFAWIKFSNAKGFNGLWSMLKDYLVSTQCFNSGNSFPDLRDSKREANTKGYTGIRLKQHIYDACIAEAKQARF